MNYNIGDIISYKNCEDKRKSLQCYHIIYNIDEYMMFIYNMCTCKYHSKKGGCNITRIPTYPFLKVSIDSDNIKLIKKI